MTVISRPEPVWDVAPGTPLKEAMKDNVFAAKVNGTTPLQDVTFLMEKDTTEDKLDPPLFATWLGAGRSVKSMKLNEYFVKAVRRAHPNCSIVVITGTEDVVVLPPGEENIEVFRTEYDKDVMGRNPYANYYQYIGQMRLLEHLVGQGRNSHVVWTDSDIIYFDSILEVFNHQYDYGMTVSDAVDMPVNIGVMFTRAGRYQQAINFLKELLRIYDFGATFTAGQVAIAQFCQLLNSSEAVHSVRQLAYQHNHCLQQLPGTFQDSYTVCFFPCLRYNFCNCGQSCCTDPGRHEPPPRTAQEYQQHDMKVVHFVGPRKSAMEFVWKALDRGGISLAYDTFSKLPEKEEDYSAWAQRMGTRAFDPYDPNCLVFGAEEDPETDPHPADSPPADTPPADTPPAGTPPAILPLQDHNSNIILATGRCAATSAEGLKLLLTEAARTLSGSLPAAVAYGQTEDMAAGAVGTSLAQKGVMGITAAAV